MEIDLAAAAKNGCFHGVGCLHLIVLWTFKSIPMIGFKTTFSVALSLAVLWCQGQEDSTIKPTTKTTSQKLDVSKAIADYAGFYNWDDYIQMYPAGIRQDSSYSVGQFPVTSDLYGIFAVQSVALDQNGTDTNVTIKYLYYMKDKQRDKPSASSAITNYIYFLRYNFSGSLDDFNKLNQQQKVSRTFGTDQKYFIVRMSVFRSHAKKVVAKTITKGALGFGILNYPFKLRIQPHLTDFTGSFNIGAAVSFTYKHDSVSKWTFSHVLGIGISSITLDKAAVNTDTAGVASTNSLAALTLSYGLMVQYDKIQLGLFIGWDRISNLNNNTYGWKYQGNPWISIGLGYSIFSTSTTTQEKKSDTQPN